MLYTTSQVFLDPLCLGFLYSDDMTIGARLRQLRTDHALSQDKLGEYCGVTKGMVSQWELNIVTPPTDRLIDLRKKLDFSYDWLLIDASAVLASEPGSPYRLGIPGFHPEDWNQLSDSAKSFLTKTFLQCLDGMLSDEQISALQALADHLATPPTIIDAAPSPPAPEKPRDTKFLIDAVGKRGAKKHKGGAA